MIQSKLEDHMLSPPKWRYTPQPISEDTYTFRIPPGMVDLWLGFRMRIPRVGQVSMQFKLHMGKDNFVMCRMRAISMENTNKEPIESNNCSQKPNMEHSQSQHGKSEQKSHDMEPIKIIKVYVENMRDKRQFLGDILLGDKHDSKPLNIGKYWDCGNWITLSVSF